MEKPFDHRPRGRRSLSTRWSRLTPILSLGFGRVRKSAGDAHELRPTARSSARACSRADRS